MSAIWTLIDLLAGRRDPATLDAAAWEEVISVARAEALATTLAERLANAAVPEAVAALFADLSAAGPVQQTQALWEAEMARRTLTPVGVRFVLLKGTAYAAANLPNAAGRQIGDLDILIDADDLPRAEAALLAAGWEWVKSDPYDDAYYRNHMHELPPLIHRERDRMIDVHHTILPLTHRARPDAAAMLADAVQSLPGGNGSFLLLSPPDMVIHCAAHVMADGDLAGGLRNLWDFHLLADLREDEWQRAVERASRQKLAEPLCRCARLATYLFGEQTVRDNVSLTLTDRMFLRAITARDDWARPTRPILRLAFYIRSHWLRMPMPMLARHLWTKWRKA